MASCKKFPCTATSEPLTLPKPEDIDKDKPFKLTYSYSVEFVVSLGNSLPLQLIYIYILRQISSVIIILYIYNNAAYNQEYTHECIKINVKYHVQIHNNIYGANSIIKLANTGFFSKFLFVHTIIISM